MSIIALKPKIISWSDFFQIYREPVITYAITPNNSPIAPDQAMRRGARNRYLFDDPYDHHGDKIDSDMILNVISGLFSRFYLPERVRLSKSGVKVKLNDCVSYKIVFQNGVMKFFLTVPQRWAKSFTNAIKRDWGQVDITPIESNIIEFDHRKAKAMDIQLKHHHSLAIRHSERMNPDPLYPALSSIGATVLKTDKLIVDFNIEPLDNSWKTLAYQRLRQFKKGKVPTRDERSYRFIINKIFEFVNAVMEESITMIHDLMGVEKVASENEQKELWDLEYSDKKMYESSKGYKVQIRSIAESEDSRRAKHMLKSVESAFSTLDGDNQFIVRHVRTKSGMKSIINAVENNKQQWHKNTDVFFEKEMNQLVRIPDKSTLKDYQSSIEQDNFTRTDIHNDFLQENHQPIAKTLDKDSKVIYMPDYERKWWTEKGREALEKTKLDDNCQPEILVGQQGSGKTSIIVRKALQKFGANLPYDEWKEKSKSVVVFDVADGETLSKIWNHVPTHLRDRVIILNHSIPEQPIPVNFAELEEFNRKVMSDPDYAYRLAEMEAMLVKEILQSDKSILVDRWFTTALQIVHMANVDWGYAEAIRFLVDDDFRINEVVPSISDERMLLEIEVYNEMRAEGQTNSIIQTVQNRFTQLERDNKLWDCIAQKPLRDEEGNCLINFRKWMDGDENGAYLVLVYIPKDGVSDKFRKFIFAHYFLKVWNVALSREKGFAGREFRPETLCIVDEIHQIIDIPIIAKTFIDLFKEPRKYSLKFCASAHGKSSFAKAGRSLESDIYQSMLDNGCNLIMLKGGRDMFESMQHFLHPMSVQDYDNLMNMNFCGIFGVKWQGKYHVFQGKLLPEVEKDKTFGKYDTWDLYDLASYKSPYSRTRDAVRAENIDRIRSMLRRTLMEMTDDGELAEGVEWSEIEKGGTRGKK